MKSSAPCPRCGRKLTLWEITPSRTFRCRCGTDLRFDWGWRQKLMTMGAAFATSFLLIILGESLFAMAALEARWTSVFVRTGLWVLILVAYHVKQLVALNFSVLHEVDVENTAKRLDVDRVLRRHLRKLTPEAFRAGIAPRLSKLRSRYFAVNAAVFAMVAGLWLLIFLTRPPLGFGNESAVNFAWFSLLLYVPAAFAGRAWKNRTLSVDGIDRLIVKDVPALGANDGTPEGFCLRLAAVAQMRRSLCWLMPLPATAFCIGPLMLAGPRAPIVYWIDFLVISVSLGLVYGEAPSSESIMPLFDERILPLIRELKAEP